MKKHAKASEGILREIAARQHIRIRLLCESIIVGLLAGLILSLYRFLIPHLSHYFQIFYAWGRTGALPALLLLFALFVLGSLVGLFSQLEPKIGGSGIPQVTGQLRGQISMRWQRILPLKFIAGLFALGAGLKVGREGPSIQMGAAVAQGFGEILKRPLSERRYLISGGAAAGLSAAFNAPLSGVIFALEEVHRSFSPLALIAAMSASFSADFISVQILGQHPVLNLGELHRLSLSSYPLIILLGLWAGLCAWLFTGGISFTKKLYARLPFPQWLKVSIPFVATGLVILLNSSVFGSGEALIFLPLNGNVGLLQLLFLYLLNLFLLLLAFASGMPGGIFFPMLVLGALLGNIFGEICVFAGLLPREAVMLFAVLAMCANFASIVRSPLTGIVLTIELTGSFTFLLPLGIVAFAAYLIAEATKLEPVYEMLLDFQLHPEKLCQGHVSRKAKEPICEALADDVRLLSKTAYAQHGVLLQYPVDINSAADGKQICELPWPDKLLLVSVRRGTEEILPRGNVLLQAGDYLVALQPSNAFAEISPRMNAITKQAEANVGEDGKLL